MPLNRHTHPMARMGARLRLAILLTPTMLLAQAPIPARFLGTWRLALVDNVLPDGTRVQLYGPHPEGLLTLDAQGRYTVQILRAVRPPFASGDKAKGTAEENAASVKGSNSHFGTYTVNEPDHTLTFRIEHAFFSNWEGTVQTRAYTLEGDDLRYTVPTPTTGGIARGEVGWRRAR